MTTSLTAPSGLAVPHDAGSARGVASWIALWLWSVAGLVILMVMVGGATRLTGSGLSITEWKPVMGALPPLSAADWAAEFARYRDSPQYQLLNSGMSLADFQSIYWWEWGHRQLGRFIGLVYAGGFLFGLARRAFPLALTFRLLLIGVLLGLQGLVGWIMVASGLKPGMTAVEPVGLASHLVLASLFLAALVATATGVGWRGIQAPGSIPAGAALVAKLLVALILVQIGLGALVAGSHAGLIYNSWPLMDGKLAPPLRELFAASPWWANLVENASLIQLDHRIGAYLVLVLAIANAALWWRKGDDRRLARLALALLALVGAQLALGIVTLLLAVPFAAALAHQLLAMAALVAAVRFATLSNRSHSPAGSLSPYDG